MTAPSCDGAALRKVVHRRLQILHLDYPLLEHGAPTQRSVDNGHIARCHRAEMGDEAQVVSFDAKNDDIVRFAQFGCAAGDGVEYGLHVVRRVRDDAQDLAGRCLLLPGLGQFPGTLL